MLALQLRSAAHVHVIDESGGDQNLPSAIVC
jgi:uncharacterized protein (UPF0147 family)